jgi:hypothetical protein
MEVTVRRQHPPDIPSELISHLNRGDCVLFVGDALDGVSQSARLAASLVDACGAHCPFCQDAEKCQRPDDCMMPLFRAAQLYEDRTNRQALVDFVLHHLDNTRPPELVHRALTELPVRVIITTAYDDRLETALRTAGRPFRSVVRDTDVPFDDPTHVQLIRLHGSLSRPDSLVLTEDNAADLFARLPVITKILQGHFASKTLLFLGYRLADPHFLALYHQVTGPIARYNRLAYAVQPYPDRLLVDRWRGKITLLDAEPLPVLVQLAQSVRMEARKEAQAVLPPEPYKFLDYYTRDDAAIFFGRDLEADLLLSTILAHNLTVFYGRSGTGKTSLLLAKVAPQLEAAGYRVAYARMLGDPVGEIKAAARGVTLEQLSYADRGRSLREVLVDAVPPGGRLVVVLDQFEEFFLRQGAAVRAAFAQELVACLRPVEDATAPDLRFVLSLRDDYLGALDELSAWLPQDVFAHRFKLENLSQEKALLAIIKPAEKFALPVEEALWRQLLADLSDQGLEPANLQIVLYRLYQDAVTQNLWDETVKQGAGLTLARYRAWGGTREILAGYLDEVITDLETDEARRHARVILKNMVTAQQTKAALSGKEIAKGQLVAQLGLAEAELDALLDYLRGRRIVRKFGDEDRYELTHEVLVEKVWAWISDEELRVLDVRDMLRRELSNYEKFEHLLTKERLELVGSCCEALALEPDELDLLLRSALAAGYEVDYWFRRAQQGGVDMDAIAREGLRSENFRTRAAAVMAMGRLGAVFVDDLIGMLGDPYPQVRMATIAALERLRPDGAWREHLVHECYVPAGPFLMGSEYGGSDEKPVHEVYLDAYYIGKYPVTNAEYAHYTEDIQQLFDMPVGKENHPVVNVNWYDARNYATWAGMRLLTEAEWEKAASVEPRLGSSSLRSELPAAKRKYPWGDAFDKTRCNTYESGIGTTTPVGQYSPQGDSPYGCADIAGNVWEWTSSLYKSYPYRPDDGREDMSSSSPCVLRGGSFNLISWIARCASRAHLYPDGRDASYGFRVGGGAPFSPTSELGSSARVVNRLSQ